MQTFIKHSLTSFILVLSIGISWGQCNIGVDFDIPDTVCIGENFTANNTSTIGTNFEWDFSDNDEKDSLIITSISNKLSSISIPLRSQLIKKNSTEYFYFFINRDNNTICKIIYDSQKTFYSKNDVIVLGNLGGNLNKCEDFYIHKENNTFYILVLNRNSNNLILGTFNESLNNTPTYIKTVDSNLSTPRKMTFFTDNSQKHLIISNTGNKTLTILNFRESVINDIESRHRFVINTGISSLSSIYIHKYCGEWIALINNNSNKIYQLEWQDSLFTTPLITTHTFTNDKPTIYTFLPFINNHQLTLLLFDASIGKVYTSLFDLTKNAPPTFYETPTNNYIPKTAAISFVKYSSTYIGVGLTHVTNSLYKYTFQDPFKEYPNVINKKNTAFFKYNKSGNTIISLSSFDQNNELISKVSKPIFIKSDTTSLSFTQNENCLSVPTTFSTSNNKPITSHNWNFGDNNTSTQQNPSHQYASADTFLVTLNVVDDQNCKNQISKEVYLYEEPKANFDFNNIICTNQKIDLINTSTGETGEIVNWKWTLNDTSNYSSTKDTTVSFQNSGNFKVKLNASILGCSDSLEKTLTTIEGPEVKFSALEKCFKDSTKFINLTTGNDITGYKWYFGNGDSSSVINPSIQYDTAKTFNIRLRANNIQGCSNTFDTTYTVHPLPTIDFNNGLSCSNSTTEFYNRTSIPSDTIKTYQWQLNNQIVDAVKDPKIFIPNQGTQFIKLIATSSFTCKDSLIKAINTTQSPNILIEQENNCFGDPTKFIDESTDIGTITDRKWSIKDIDATSVSTTFNHTFENAGSYTVYLNLNSSTGCKTIDSTTISLTPLPQPTFTTSQLCLGDSINFYNTNTIGSGDSISKIRWFFESAGFQEGDSIKVKFSKSGTENIIIELLTKNGCSSNISSAIEIKEDINANFSLDKNIGSAPLTVNATASQSTGQHTWLVANNDTLRTTNITSTYDTNNTYSLVHILKGNNGCIDSVSKSIFVGNYLFDIAVTGLGLKDSLDNTYLTVLLQNNSPLAITSPSVLIDINNVTKLNTKLNNTLSPNTVTSIDIPIGISKQSIALSNYICVEIDTNSVKDFVSKNNSYCMVLNESINIKKPTPNPTDGELQFNIYSPKNQTVTITIYNTLGKVVKTQTVLLNVGNNTITENLMQYSNSIYIIDVNSENQHTKFRVTKH